MSLRLEEIVVGDRRVFPLVRITQEMRDAHVALYGEDWSGEELVAARKRGVIPSTMIHSIAGGQMGAADWIAIEVLKGYPFGDAKFEQSFCVGDTMQVVSEIMEVKPHRDPTKEYGYVKVDQHFLNEQGELVYWRQLTYPVKNAR